jgi:hypothetical protein
MITAPDVFYRLVEEDMQRLGAEPPPLPALHPIRPLLRRPRMPHGRRPDT